MKCASCKKPMHVVYTRYEPRDGRNVQAEVQLKCDCGMTVTISDPQLPSKSRSHGQVRGTAMKIHCRCVGCKAVRVYTEDDLIDEAGPHCDACGMPMVPFQIDNSGSQQHLPCSDK